jgi:hypothetical protein
MSALLLTVQPELLEDIQTRDAAANALDECGAAILATREAIVCKETLAFLYRSLAPRREESEHDDPVTTKVSLDEGFTLHIIHDALLMGPRRFLNVDHGEYFSPKGLWIIVKGDDLTSCRSMRISEAVRAWKLARNYTLKANAAWADMMNYTFETL